MIHFIIINYCISLNLQLSQEVAKATKKGKILLTVGGDHR